MNKDFSSNNALLKLISNGIKLWIRSQCKINGDLKLDLTGSLKDLIRGKLEKCELHATNAVYKGLKFKEISLESGQIDMRLNFLNPNTLGKATINENFTVQGKIIMDGEMFARSLKSDQWEWLAIWLSNKLTRLDRLSQINIEGNHLLFKPKDSNDTPKNDLIFSMKSSKGKIILYNENIEEIFPLDEAIKIENATLNGSEIELIGQAKVTI